MELSALGAEFLNLAVKLTKGSKHSMIIWGFPWIRSTCLTVPIGRTIVFWGPHWGRLFWETTIYIPKTCTTVRCLHCTFSPVPASGSRSYHPIISVPTRLIVGIPFLCSRTTLEYAFLGGREGSAVAGVRGLLIHDDHLKSPGWLAIKRGIARLLQTTTRRSTVLQSWKALAAHLKSLAGACLTL